MNQWTRYDEQELGHDLTHDCHSYDEDQPCCCCPACSNSEATLLGTLGDRAHFRCRACGMDYSIAGIDEELVVAATF